MVNYIKKKPNEYYNRQFAVLADKGHLAKVEGILRAIDGMRQTLEDITSSTGFFAIEEAEGVLTDVANFLREEIRLNGDAP